RLGALQLPVHPRAGDVPRLPEGNDAGVPPRQLTEHDDPATPPLAGFVISTSPAGRPVPPPPADSHRSSPPVASAADRPPSADSGPHRPVPVAAASRRGSPPGYSARR